ncbi:MAG: hypothetical protein ACJ75H_18655 [Thermoanaerobaculia bacterium]
MSSNNHRRALAAFALLTALALPLAARPVDPRVHRAERPAPSLATRVVSWLKDALLLTPPAEDPNGATGGTDPGLSDGRGGWDPNG